MNMPHPLFVPQSDDTERDAPINGCEGLQVLLVEDLSLIHI